MRCSFKMIQQVTRFLILIAMIAMCTSCGSSGNDSFKDATLTLTISDTCAVIYRPSGDKLTYLKNTFDKNSFPALVQTNNTAIIADSIYLSKQGIKVISTSKSRLKFHKKKGEDIFINLNVPKYAWEIFLFNTFNDPEKADLSDIESSVQDAAIK